MIKEAKALADGRILVVDDGISNLHFVISVLEERGYTVYPASNGELALEFVQKTIPDLILLDIRMPGIDGFEVCRRLKAEERTRSIPIIFISASKNEDDMVKGFQEGGVDYIVKPFKSGEMLARIHTHLRLRELTERLEQKVAERTAELHAVNMCLKNELAERKEAEKALSKSEEKYRTLFENINEGFALFKTIVNENGVPIDYMLLESNPAFETITGFKREQVIGRTIREVLPGIEKDPADWIGRYGTVALTGEGISFEDYSKQIGRWYQLNAFSPGTGLFAVTFTDITERKMAEKELHQLNSEQDLRILERTAELKRVNKELEAFAYSVSHDLRAPLRHIDSFLGLLSKEIVNINDKKVRHYFDVISTSANKMGQLIDNLLSFSRISRQNLQTTHFKPTEMIRSIIRELEPDMGDRSIEWDIGEIPEVVGDISMINIVLMNLISNSVKFTRMCKCAKIEIGYQAAAHEHVIFIRDNGVGFDSHYSDKLFKVFQRLHGAEEFEGTGIGLALAQRIIQRHGGRIWAEGKIGQGAVFYFSLPVPSSKQ